MTEKVNGEAVKDYGPSGRASEVVDSAEDSRVAVRWSYDDTCAGYFDLFAGDTRLMLEPRDAAILHKALDKWLEDDEKLIATPNPEPVVVEGFKNVIEGRRVGFTCDPERFTLELDQLDTEDFDKVPSGRVRIEITPLGESGGEQ